jgi:4-hydroxy-tetrahydrodipicolinate reductase
MSTKTRVAVYGTGRIGREVVKGCVAADHVELVGAVVTDEAKKGRDVGELCGIEPLGIPATTQVDDVLARADVDLIFYCGLGEPAEVAEHLGRFADAGKDSITLTGLIHPEAALGKDGAAALHARAKRGGAHIVGAGWNPGFLLDVLPVVYATSCVRLDRIYAQRVAEMRDWGAGVHEECGIGYRLEDVRDTNSNPLHESVALIADALGMQLDRIDNMHEPYPSRIVREHRGIRVEPDRNAGFHKRSTGVVGGRPLIEVEMYGVFCIDPQADEVSEGARIVVEGESRVETECTGDWFGDSYPVTAAKAIWSVGPLRALPPGLYRPDQLSLATV